MSGPLSRSSSAGRGLVDRLVGLFEPNLVEAMVQRGSESTRYPLPSTNITNDIASKLGRGAGGRSPVRSMTTRVYTITTPATMMTIWVSSSRPIHITKWAQSAIVPDPSNVMDYNRFMMVRGNPLKYNDPTGHCVLNSDGSRNRDTTDNSDCWNKVDIIGMMWDQTDYWNNRFKSREGFEHLANHSYFDAEYMYNELKAYTSSDVYIEYNNCFPNCQDVGHYSLPNPLCSFWDCPAVVMDATSLVLSIAQTGTAACTATVVGAPACGPATGYLTAADVGVRTGSAIYTTAQYANGDGTGVDLALLSTEEVVVPALRYAGIGASVTPGIGIAYDSVMLGYDILIEPFTSFQSHGVAR